MACNGHGSCTVDSEERGPVSLVHTLSIRMDHAEHIIDGMLASCSGRVDCACFAPFPALVFKCTVCRRPFDKSTIRLRFFAVKLL